MTPEELVALVQSGDRRRVIDALRDLDEKSRRKLAPRVKELLKASDPGWHIFDEAERAVCDCARLAAIGTFTWTEVRRVDAFNPHENELSGDDVADVLTARRPEWLARWLQWRLEHRPYPWSWSKGLWTCIRRVAKSGTCEFPKTDEYVRLFAGTNAGVGWIGRDDQPPCRITEALLADPGLLEDELWRLLELSVTDERLFRDEAGEGAERVQTWLTAISELCEKGSLDRSGVLDTVLATLGRPRHRDHAAWLIRLHERLAPTTQDVAAREVDYVALLGDPEPTVAAFAGRHLLQIDPKDHAGIARHMSGLFTGKHKGPAELGLRLARRYGASSARAVIEALVHPKAAIQTEAIAFLEAVCTEPDIDLAEAVERRTSDVAASIAPRVAALARRLRHGEDVDLAPVVVVPRAAARLGELRAVAHQFAGRADLAISELLRGEIVPIHVNPLGVRRLYRAVAPIRDIDELVDGLLRQRQFHIEVDEWERLLDGLSRLADRRGRGLDDRFAPVLVGEQPSAFVALLQARQGVAMSAEPTKSDMPWRDQGPRLRHFVHARLHEVAERIRVGHLEPVVALPTHSGGWIDGRVLVERLRRNPEPGLYDMVQALLRLAPDGRAEALRAAESLATRAGAALRWALGAPKRPAGVGMALLVAASRARDPLGDVEGAPGCGPDGTEAAKYAWRFLPRKQSQERPREMRFIDREFVAVDVTPSLGDRENDPRLVETPTVLQHRLRLPIEWWTNDGDVLDPPLRGLWPLNPDSILAWGIVQISHDIDAAASPYLRRSTYLQPLFDPDTPFSEVGQVLLAVSFGAADADVRVSATDAAVALANDGRMVGDELGAVAARLIPTGALKLNRLADALGEIARTNVLCAHVAANVAHTVLAAGAPDRPLPLLERLRELLAELDAPLRADARPQVEQLAKSSGKTASVASDLLERTGAGRREEVLVLALEGRIARAHR